METEPVVTLDLALQHGLSEEEYDQITSILGRTPTFTELGIYSVMWSEHCSYKNSLALLKTLPTKSDSLLTEAGDENAGIIDIGDGLAVAFKIESHNHPSAVEPFQGAATGVGGILRDIFTMGARPIAVLDSLRFGDINHPRTRYLVSYVVKGIGYYGNCFGVPTVGGEVNFDSSYNTNPLVNAMAVGLLDKRELIRAAAKGVGNPVVIVGSSTGRDGIHGATFASEEISSKSEERRPSVQVGDPFTEKCLLEALLEASEAGCLVGVQDMGAAGIACSTSEMSARGGCGMQVNLDLVPIREQNMSPYEIALSESQERMLIVTEPRKLGTLTSIFAKWDLHAVQIGEVIAENAVRYLKGGRVVAEIPATSLAAGHGAPVYTREKREPAYLSSTRSFDDTALPAPQDLDEVLLGILGTPNISHKGWVYEQYDNAVQTNTATGPSADAAVMRIKGSHKLLAITTDGNSRYVYLSPRLGARIAVAEAARNIVCVGGRPLAITNCLNFGNPYDPEVYWQFAEVVAGMSEACKALGTPVTGGNVSFYNEGPDGAIFPTPVIGMVGIIDDEDFLVTPNFKDPGDFIFLLGENTGHVGGSEYLRYFHNATVGEAPGLDLELEIAIQRAVLALTRSRLIKSAHDVSEGGLAIALAESCILNPKKPMGARISIPATIRPDFLLFGEDQSRILITASTTNAEPVQAILREKNIPFHVIGEVQPDHLTIDNLHSLFVTEIVETYYSGFRNTMGPTK
ncbi:MAG: phosphoribosylformylglycinamidine synthase subunit PurL [Bacteroidota bacterium]